VLETAGIRLAIAGFILVGVSIIGLVAIGDIIPAFGMMIGGVAVIAGFIWTLAHFYRGE
jgi:hypothetical protein